MREIFTGIMKAIAWLFLVCFLIELVVDFFVKTIKEILLRREFNKARKTAWKHKLKKWE